MKTRVTELIVASDTISVAIALGLTTGTVFAVLSNFRRRFKLEGSCHESYYYACKLCQCDLSLPGAGRPKTAVVFRGRHCQPRNTGTLGDCAKFCARHRTQLIATESLSQAIKPLNALPAHLQRCNAM
jgi:hypothetical protein